MKNNISKFLGSIGLTLAALFVLAPRSYAVNLQDAQQAYFDATANAGSIYGGASSPTINISFSGKTQAGAVAASSGAYVTISATAMTFYQPFGTVDASVGTAGVITYSTQFSTANVGALCDYLQGLGASYKCSLIGSKRDDTLTTLQTQTATNGTNNLAAAGGFGIQLSTTNFISLGITPAAGKRVVLKQCIVNGVDNTAPGGYLYVYGQLRKYGAIASPFARDANGVVADDTYVVWKSSTVANTNLTQPSSNAVTNWIEFAQGAHVVVRVGLGNTLVAGGGSGVESATNFVNCIWDEKGN